MTTKDERLARANALRTTALLILKRRGFTQRDRTLEIARVGKIKIEYRNTSPALQIWEQGRKVFSFGFYKKGKESLVIYEPGNWKRTLAEHKLRTGAELNLDERTANPDGLPSADQRDNL
jgi:hypothetical protein